MEKRKLGEQLVITVDKQKHLMEEVEGWGNHIREVCIVNESGEVRRVFAKDLGILNEDGCLHSPWGGYPKIIHEVNQTRIENGEDVHYDNLWCVEIHEPVLVCTDEYLTEQEAIDAWNRRA